LTAAELRRAAQKELQRRARVAVTALVGSFSLEAIARGANGTIHVPQLRYMSSVALRILKRCSRRAGKTWGIGGRYAKRSTAKPNGNRAYIALTKDQAREIMWEPIWKPLCASWGLCDIRAHNETRMVTTFPNGSRVRFTGSDDLRHIATELGAALDEVTIDECQDQSDAVLRALVGKILPPALGSEGVLTMSGVFPEVQAGYFHEMAESGRWENHNFSMFDNPHYPNPQMVVDNFLRDNSGYTLESPLVQRDYYGRSVYDASATAYGYRHAFNRYEPTEPAWLAGLVVPSGVVSAAVPHNGIEVFSAGIDPGTRDRVSMQVHGWGAGSPIIQHVFDWTSAKNAHLTWSQIADVARVVQQHFQPAFWHYDAGSSQNELDVFSRTHGIPVIKAANKSDMPGQVRLVRDLLGGGRYKVMAHSSLEEDYTKARFDPEARARGQYKWASQWHPDAGDAGRYSLKPYFDMYVAPVVKTHEQTQAEELQDIIDKALRGHREQDVLGKVLGFSADGD
jgi:hypothetical protein